jgi:flagellar hook-associated protein 1 FlgK
MSGISLLLNIARGALLAQQKGIDVTGHNISNVNTPGYTRQKLILQSSEETPTARIKLGYGVNADSVIQYFDRFTTQNINQKTSSLSEYEAEKSILDYVEGLFNEETENGLNKVVTDFWNAWQDLSNNPGGTAERTALLQKAQNLCQKFQMLRNDLTKTRDEMNWNLKGAIEETNALGEQIARMNERIGEAEANGTTANDLRDQRNNLIEELSQLTEITYLEKDNGALTVITKSGIALVDGNLSWTLSQEGNNIYWNEIQNDISDRLTGGKMGAWLDLRDSILPQYMANLDELAGTMIHQINDLHYNHGYTLGGETNKYFFNHLAFASDVVYGTWGSTSIASAGGIYASTAPAGTFQFTVTSVAGEGKVGTDAITLGWTGPGGTSGTITLDSSYIPATLVDVAQGLQVSLGNGTVVNGNTFSIDVVPGAPCPDYSGAARDIALSPDVENQPQNIAASRSSNPLETGNNINALAIQALQDEPVSIKKWMLENRGIGQSNENLFWTMDEYYNILVGDIGMLTDAVEQNQNFHQAMINQLNELRDSVSGVNLDEEMINMMKYQYAFIAASKMVNASDEMLQTVLAMRP